MSDNSVKQTILIVEDEIDIRELLVFNLQEEGYNTLEAENGEIALSIIHNKNVDLILLDLMMPVMDGLSLCKALAKEGNTIPIVMLTARGEEMDKIVGLEFGADDYVVKPFNVRELILRIKALLRRQAHIPENEKNKQNSSIITHGNLVIDTEAHTLSINKETIETTATEFRLIEDLVKHAGHVRTREQLLNSVWGYEFEGYGRTVDTHIRRLRAKLGDNANLIDTVRGIGYKFFIETK